MRKLMLLSIVLAAVTAPAASAQSTRVPAPLLEGIRTYTMIVENAEDKKCRELRDYGWKPAEIPVGYRPYEHQRRRSHAIHAMFAGARCNNVFFQIARYFGPYAGQARTVCYCESRYYRFAVNGQYRGLFQMGESEREKYGHGYTAEAQVRAAYAYFADSGYDWSPWECKP